MAINVEFTDAIQRFFPLKVIWQKLVLVDTLLEVDTMLTMNIIEPSDKFDISDIAEEKAMTVTVVGISLTGVSVHCELKDKGGE